MRKPRWSVAFLPIMLWLVACSSPTANSPMTSINATGTWEVSAKETDQAQVANNVTPSHETAPTGQASESLPACQASDLLAEANAEGATGAMTFSLRLVNNGAQYCTLHGPPDVKLVDQNGHVLDIVYRSFCFECLPAGNDYVTPEPAVQTAMPPTATAQAEQILNRILALAPGQGANVFMIWRNWCQPFPEGGVGLRLLLAEQGGRIDTPTNAQTGGRCDDQGGASTFLVSQFQN